MTGHKQGPHIFEQIKKLKYHRPSTEFREVWQYNNNMYTVLSYLPTALLPSQIPFTRFVKEHIFDPLDMTSTTYSYDIAVSSGQLSDGMARRGFNTSVDIFGGIPTALPYWSTSGGEDGTGKSNIRPTLDATRLTCSGQEYLGRVA